QQAIRIRGKIADNLTDSLQVAFSEFNLASLNTLTKKSGYEMGGVVNGTASVNDLYKTMNLTSGLYITNLVVNNDVLGNASISTTWNNQKKGVGVNATIFRGPLKTFDVNGTYYPTGEKLDFDISLDKFKLNMLRSYVKSFATINKGIATGNMKLVGTASDPDLSGMLELQQVNIRVDYLNAVYSFADKIEIRKDAFILNGLTLNDTVGNKAIVTGQITHNRFKDFNIDLNISANNLACLNTNANMNNMFYGKASITGLIAVTGPPENIRIDIDAKTEKHTQLFIPISDATEASNNSFIHFTSSEKNSKTDDSYLPDFSGLQLNFDFEVTTDAELQIILDQKAGDIIRSRGNGNLNMNINTLGDFKMFGDYIIEDGDYLFTMENIINKKFKVKQGGSLKWNGDPYDADLDIEAVYDLKASLYDLRLDIDTSKKRVPVACTIFMKDKLFNPSISFDIDFPGMDEFAREQYKAVVRPDINKQVFALLVLTRFVLPTAMQGGSEQSTGGNNALGANSSELLSNQLSNWLSQISQEFDIGVNYRPGDEISRDEVEVALSTQLFNDRVSIDGNFGVAGQQQAASNIVGDVNIEAKPFKKGNLKLKAYNKTNTSNDQFKKNSPYTQGMGLFYRKEFNSFRELFKRKKKEKNSK
ncbi:MAG: translocation/assembly module TamB domain-containing protein, partial [Bacteroidota bacterium]